MEALNKAYAGKGISFYWVLSREPHPGFYGFTQTDSLEMRQEYVRLADAELSIQMPWIIDDMDNTMQITYGRRPNSEFIISPDGTLLESREWADPDKLKDWLEENIGPSGIAEEEWARLSQADQTARAVGNNDEVPMTEVPRQALHFLETSRLDDSGSLPFTFRAGTLPPNITSDGQSRLYFLITPELNTSFDKAQTITSISPKSRASSSSRILWNQANAVLAKKTMRMFIRTLWEYCGRLKEAQPGWHSRPKLQLP